jgi:predicted RNA-binding protein YlxR (DUF448 family)
MSTMTKKTKKVPMRRCVGCMESKPKKSMIRIAYYEGVITVDPTGKAKGRGVYLCKTSRCMDKAQKRKALQRNFEAEIPGEETDRIFEELKSYEE